MSVQDWTPEKRVTVEIRKALRSAQNAGASTDFATLAPAPMKALAVGSGESLCAGITNREGRQFQFSESALYLEGPNGVVRLPYASIVACDWITDSGDVVDKLRQKQERGDHLILRDSSGVRHELDGLGWAFQGMHNFFWWLLRRQSRERGNS